MAYMSSLGPLSTSINASPPAELKVKMSQRRINEGTSAEERSQQPTATYWNNAPIPTWMGPLAYYNEDMEGQFRTGLSYMLPRMTHGLSSVSC